MQKSHEYKIEGFAWSFLLDTHVSPIFPKNGMNLQPVLLWEKSIEGVSLTNI